MLILLFIKIYLFIIHNDIQYIIKNTYRKPNNKYNLFLSLFLNDATYGNFNIKPFNPSIENLNYKTKFETNNLFITNYIKLINIPLSCINEYNTLYPSLIL